jgi:TonB family protein
MKQTTKALVISLGILVAGVAPILADSAALDTRVTMVVGFPGSGGEVSSVLVVPGTVIPVSRSHRRQVDVGEEGAEQARELQELADKLKKAVGLDSMEVAYSEVYPLAEGKARSITGPRARSEIQGDLTLMDFNEDLAVYRVVLRQGSDVLADSKVAVERGGRAVVGGLDGEEAPYFFLVLQPAAKAMFVKGDIVAPRKIHAVSPKYTEVARKEGIQGVVVLQAVITKEGIVEEVEVHKGLPYGLTETAIEALKQWTFEPATLEGEPVDVYYNLTFNFRLSDDKKPEEEG